MLAAGNPDEGYVLLLIVSTIVVLVWLLLWRRRVMRAGYRGAFAYLRALPKTDIQKRNALDLLMRGAVLIPIGIVLWPLLVIGLFSFYYGLRKMCMLKMGLENVDEPVGLSSETGGETPATPSNPTM